METLTVPSNPVADRIIKLKQEQNAVFLAHYYEDGPIQDLADYVGDSLYLAQMGAKSTAPVLLMAGVVFMAESVKILSPKTRVLVPDLKAGCSLVDSSPYDDYLRWRLQHPDGIAVTYINSSAAVKSISDIICTSSNAEKIIESIPKNRPILFGPDKNLGSYLSKKTGREMILWPGACEVHVLFSARKLFELKENHPDALVLAHPECTEPVLQYADVIGSTSRLLKEVEQNPRKKFIIATEDGIFHQMRKLRPEANLIQAPAEGSCACNQCPYMKLNTLEKIEQALDTLQPEILLPPQLIERAKIPLERMLEISAGYDVKWPTAFAPTTVSI
ncbi:MAG: quinolinate synthase NadA [Bdellovibrionales bacterium]|nr:quinolinate synthase NadA [Bdellovibrionales bacterium]